MLTPRQEAFAAGVAKGLTQAEAFRRAYEKSRAWKDATVHSKASVLAANSKIQARVAELQAKAAAANELTLAEHLRTLLELREEARAKEDYSAAIKAEGLRGKCSGLYTERVEHSGPDGAPIKLTW